MALTQHTCHLLRGLALGTATVAAGVGLVAVGASAAQLNGSREAFTQLNRGMVISIRTIDPIDTRSANNRVYRAVVDQEAWGENGRLAIPRDSPAELIVRTRDDSLVLDLESVTVRGQRYAVQTDPNRIAGTSGTDALVGSVLDATRGAIDGTEVRLPRGMSVTFRLERSLEVGIPDRGRTRNGFHYHDYFYRDRDRF
jgi:hypothetical protein